MRRALSIAGGIFAVAFFVGLLLVGDQAGAFADAESAYTDIFSDNAHRTQDIAGSLLLIVSAIAFGVFGYLSDRPVLDARRDEQRVATGPSAGEESFIVG